MKASTLGSIGSQVIEQVIPATVNTLMNYALSGGESKQPNTSSGGSLPNFASPSGPVFYGPGFGGSQRPNYPPGFRKRRRRRRRRKKKGGGRQRQQQSRSTATRMLMPVSYSDTICNLEPMFNISPTRTTSHGPAATIAFSNMICNLGTGGTATNNDYMNAIRNSNSLAQIGQIVSGFLSADSAWTSGLLMYPGYFTNRMKREFYNWTEYRPRWINFRYQNSVGTSTTGCYLCAFTRDPMDFIEADATATYSTATHSPSQVAETIPNCMSNIYRDFTLPIRNFDRNKWFPTEWSRAATSGVSSTSSDGAIALARQSCFGRLVVLYNGSVQNLGTTGTLWVSGVLDVAGPTSSGLMIPVTQQTVGLMSSTSEGSTYSGNLVLHDNKWKHASEVHDTMSVRDSHDRKVRIPESSSLNDRKSSDRKGSVDKSDWEETGTP